MKNESLFKLITLFQAVRRFVYVLQKQNQLNQQSLQNQRRRRRRSKNLQNL